MEIHRRTFLHLTVGAAIVPARIAIADTYPSRPTEGEVK
jgi:hypothetical protein